MAVAEVELRLIVDLELIEADGLTQLMLDPPPLLQRRVHGHASLPALLALRGTLELRSNWQLYVEEFGVAMHLAGQRGVVRKLPADGADLSLFERKYRRSGHDLWACRVRIAP